MPTYPETDQDPSRRRLRDTNIDPVHGENPDYYAETGSSSANMQQPPPPADPKQDAFRPKSSHLHPNDSYVREELHLEPYAPNTRPRSVPPHYGNAVIPRGRSSDRRRRGSSRSSSSSTIFFDEADRIRSRSRRRRSPSPISRARSAVAGTFTNSTAGIGAGLLGAVVGGLVAKGASERAARGNRSGHSLRRSESDDRTRLLTTLAGAVAGGLGANAVANKLEDVRARGRDKQSRWESRFGHSDYLPHYDSGRPADLNHRNGKGYLKPRGGWGPDGFDDDYDFVYDSRPGTRRSRSDNYRSRN